MDATVKNPHWFDDGQKECVPEDLCPLCRDDEHRRWARHFGLRPGSTPLEVRAQLQRFRTMNPWTEGA